MQSLAHRRKQSRPLRSLLNMKTDSLPETKAKHTPGPWTTGPHYTNEAIYIQQPCETSNGGWLVATVWGEDKEANARLIAAAPELLAALEAMVKADEAICENRGRKSDQAMQRIAALDAAIAAIAKAAQP